MSSEQISHYDELSLMDIWKILEKSRKQIIILFIACVLLTGIITFFFIPRKYQSHITFYLQEKGSSGTLSMLFSQLGGLGGMLPGLIGGGETSADLCSEIVMARKFLEDVLKAENLPHEPEDVEKLEKMIRVEKKMKSGAIKISVLWTDPGKACSLAKTIFKQYKKVVEGQVHGASSINRQFLEEQYEKNKKRLDKAENELLAFQKKKGVLLLPDQAVKSIEYFADLEKQKVATEIGLTEAKQRLLKSDNLLAQEAPAVRLKIVETINPVLEQYKTSLIEVEMALAEAEENYTDEHPMVKSLLAKRDEILAKMEQEKESILDGKIVAANPELLKPYLEGQIEVAGLEARGKALQGHYDQYNNMMRDLPDDMLAYGRLLREQKVAEQVYILLVSQLEQAKISEANENNIAIQVIDPPVAPHKKHSPSTALNMAVAGFLALFAGIGWAFLKEYMGEVKILQNNRLRV
ncbi:MAG: GumC family protein [Bacillota bacterium]